MTIAIIVAMARNGAIGCQGHLPWSLPEDLRHFKQLTMGHPVIMGRKTFDSLPHGPLPGRRNMVLSRTRRQIAGAEVFPSLNEALLACGPSDEVFVIGGAAVYASALPLADRLCVTEVDCEPVAADAFFPPFDATQWTQTKKEKHKGFSFSEWQRKR